MESSDLSNGTLTIEQEASEKLIDLIYSKNIEFNKSYAYNLLTNHIDFSDNRKIHNYVKSTLELRKSIDPMLRYNASKLHIIGDKPMLSKESEVLSAIDKLGFSDSISKDIFTNYVLKSLNK